MINIKIIIFIILIMIEMSVLVLLLNQLSIRVDFRSLVQLSHFANNFVITAIIGLINIVVIIEILILLIPIELRFIFGAL